MTLYLSMSVAPLICGEMALEGEKLGVYNPDMAPVKEAQAEKIIETD